MFSFSNNAIVRSNNHIMVVILCAVMAVSIMTLYGCGNSSDSAEDAEQEQQEQQQKNEDLREKIQKAESQNQEFVVLSAGNAAGLSAYCDVMLDVTTGVQYVYSYRGGLSSPIVGQDGLPLINETWKEMHPDTNTIN